MSIWSSEEKPLAAAADAHKDAEEKLYTIEEISAMIEAESRNENVAAATPTSGEMVDEGIVIPEPEIKPLIETVDAGAEVSEGEIALPEAEAAIELPETGETLLAQASADAIALPEPAAADNALPEAPVVADMLDAIDAAAEMAEEGAQPKLPEVTALAEAPAVEAPDFAAAATAEAPLPEFDDDGDADWRDQILADAEEAEAPEADDAAADAADETTDKTAGDKVTEAAAAATADAGAVAEKTAEPAAPEVAAEQAPKSQVDELVDRERIRRQAIDVEAGHFFKQGMEYFNAGRYDDALEAFDKALQSNPAMEEAAEYRTRARQLVGRPTGDQDAALLDEIVRANGARLKERELRLNAGLDKASEYYLKTVALDEARKVMSRPEQIQMNLIDLEAAEQSLNAVRALLQGSGLPREMEKSLEMRSRALAAQITEERQKLVNERATLDRQMAEAKAREEKKTAEAGHAKEINEILSAAEYHLSRDELEEALTLVEKVMMLDKTNKAAYDIRRQIRNKARQEADLKNERDLKNSEDNWALDVQEGYILPRQAVVYPLDWERIRQRARKATVATVINDAERKIMDTLNRITGNFEYVQQPLSSVIQDFGQRAKICFTCASGVDQEAEVKTGRLTDVTMKQALDQIMEDLDLTYHYEDEALVISKKENNLGESVMQIYPVIDLLRTAKSFRPKHRLAANVNDLNAFAGDDDDDDDDDDDWNEAEPFNIVDTIKKQISPDSWNESKTVVRWEDNIIVFNTPDIQQQVAKFLEEWRRSSKQQVLVEGRFMDIDDDFVEEFGIDWSGSQQGQNSHREYQTGLSFKGGVAQNNWGATYTVPGEEEAQHRTGGLFTNMGLVSTNNPLNYALNTLRLNLTIQASQKTGKGSILHNPKVLVQNGQNAFCQIIVQRPYAKSYDISDSSLIPVIDYINEGVTWDVRPVVSFDRKYVMLKVRPEIQQEVTDEELISRGILNYERFSHMEVPLMGGEDDGAAVLDTWYANIEKPVTKITDFWTNVVVPDGGTLMIGGQLRDSNTDKVVGVPILSSVPYLGRLMRTDSKIRTATNRVIMVSAKVLEMED